MGVATHQLNPLKPHLQRISKITLCSRKPATQAYYLCPKANSLSFSQNSPSLLQDSVSSLSRNSPLETLFRPFPTIGRLDHFGPCWSRTPSGSTAALLTRILLNLRGFPIHILPLQTLDGRNRAIVIAESLARVIAAIRIASVRWRSYLPPKHRN